MASTPAQYLYLWTASDDATQPDFLAVLDVTEGGSRYGRLVTTLPVPGRSNRPHHTEHEMPADGQLFANGFGSGQSFIFDLTNPTAACGQPVRRPRRLLAPSFVPAAAERPRPGHFQMRHDARHEGRRARGTHPRWHTCAFELGALCRRRSSLRVYSGAIVPAVRPDRDDDDRHGQGLPSVTQSADLATLGSFVAAYVSLARR